MSESDNEYDIPEYEIFEYTEHQIINEEIIDINNIWPESDILNDLYNNNILNNDYINLKMLSFQINELKLYENNNKYDYDIYNDNNNISIILGTPDIFSTILPEHNYLTKWLNVIDLAKKSCMCRNWKQYSINENYFIKSVKKRFVIMGVVYDIKTLLFYLYSNNVHPIASDSLYYYPNTLF
jgi:hypothetical protein